MINQVEFDFASIRSLGDFAYLEDKIQQIASSWQLEVSNRKDIALREHRRIAILMRNAHNIDLLFDVFKKLSNMYTGDKTIVQHPTKRITTKTWSIRFLPHSSMCRGLRLDQILYPPTIGDDSKCTVMTCVL